MASPRVKVSLAAGTAVVTMPKMEMDVDYHLTLACFFCKGHEPREPAWVIQYEHCRHTHLACEMCKVRIELAQKVAEEALPPMNYYASEHECCGAKIWRARWVRI